MKIAVILRKEEFQQVGDYLTVLDLLKDLNLAPEAYLILRDGKMIDADALLQDGDTLKLVPAFSGGAR